jgi:hypothetical protein
VTRRDTLQVLQAALDIGPRQARAAMSSYQWERWTAANCGLSSPFSIVSSLEDRVRVHSKRTRESRSENGKRGGRPRKPLDAASGSSCLVNRTIVETLVQTEQQEDSGVPLV